MFYRILKSPPGYDPPRNYSVAKYKTLEFPSCCGEVMNAEGTRFFATIEEARMAIPSDAIRLASEPQHQFLELWETPESETTFHAAVAEFVGAFEEVFGRDWEYSKTLLAPSNLDAFVTPGFTFINPGVDDEVEDWGARAKLLETYRRLIEAMNEQGLKPKSPW